MTHSLEMKLFTSRAIPDRKWCPDSSGKILSGDDRQPFKIGSGRLELAKAIAADDNPLTSRVIVNRIWSHHFGKGIVSSLNEFGAPWIHPILNFSII